MGIFKGGVPTKIEVDALMENIDARHGTIVSFDEIERVIGVTRDKARFRSVVEAWRKRLFREKLIQTRSIAGELHLLSDDEAHDFGKSNLSRIGRATGRLCVRVEAVDATKLSGERRDGHNLLRREANAMLDAARKSAKAIAAPKPLTPSNLRIAK
jgi:hypothetical protein